MFQSMLDKISTAPATSPLILSDRLLSLAQDAERAGLRGAAGQLVDLACAVLDHPSRSLH